MTNAKIRNRVLGTGSENVPSQLIRYSALCWLGYLLLMVNARSPDRSLFSVPSAEWKKAHTGHQMTWERGATKWTANLDKVGFS